MLTHLRRLSKFLLGRDALIYPDMRLPNSILGSSYGGWSVVKGLLNPQSVVYSCGIGTDVSFDLALIERFRCTVYAFDPTARSLKWLSKQQLPPTLHIIPVGISAHDGTLSLTPPAHADHVSFGLARGEPNGKTVEVPVSRLSTLMKELGHSTIDLLKLDIEGAEYSVIDDILQNGQLPSQINVEFHHGMRGWRVADTRRTVARLRKAGYCCFHVASTGREMGFVRL